MFKNPFSFNGRIGRLEYWLIVPIYFVITFLAGVFVGTMYVVLGYKNHLLDKEVRFIIKAVCLPLYWLVVAQGAKRCHDLGKSGWWQLIPLYFIWMLFQRGQPYENKWGKDLTTEKTIIYDPFATQQINEHN